MSTKTPEKITFKQILKGEFSRTFLIHVYTPIMITIFFASLLISALIYTNYDMTQMDISFLGAPNLNPQGWLVWSFGFFLSGLLLFPIVFYLLRQLIVIDKNIANISAFFFILAALGMSLVGLLPQFEPLGLIHQINSGCALGGLYLGLFCITPLLWKKSNIDKKKLLLVIILNWFGPVGFVASQGYHFFLDIDGFDIRTCGTGLCPWYIAFSFWEWMLMLVVFCAFILLLLTIPEQSKTTMEQIEPATKKKVNQLKSFAFLLVLVLNSILLIIACV